MQSDRHLARVETLEKPARALTALWAIASTLFIGLTPAIMTAVPLLLIGLLAVAIPSLWTTWPVLAAVTVSLGLLGYWLISYPEWPTNRGLQWRLRRAIMRRPDTVVAASEEVRMVEWVPRENWNATRLETASDVMLICVDRDGLRMEGDRARYEFPPESIIDVSVESIRPAGCFHQLHFAVVIARTEDGPKEFPIAYRDHGLNSLASSIRRQHTVELCHSIASIAKGGDFTYPHPPHESRPVPRQHLNPFAAPPTA